MRNLYTFSQLILIGRPVAQALLRGAPFAPGVSGTVQFYPAGEGTQVVAEVMGLPAAVRENGRRRTIGPFHAFHIGEAEGCGDEVLWQGLLYNPHGAPHPRQAGVLPPLFADDGYAYLSVYTSRFTPEQVIGRTAVVRRFPDDFHTQPDGGAGPAVAWGVIEPA